MLPTPDENESAIAEAATARLRAVLDQAPAGCFEASTEGAFTFVNRRWCELTSMRAADALGDGWIHAIHFEDRDRVLKNWCESVRRSHAFAMEYRVQPAAGEVGRLTWIGATAAPVFDEAGAVTGYLGWTSDVTMKVQNEEYLERALMDQVKVSERLRREEERIRLIVENTSEGIWWLTSDHRTMYANPRMAELLGCDAAEITGRPLADFLDDEVADGVVERLRMSSPRDRVLHEVSLRRTDGTYVPAMLAAASLADERGRYNGALVIVSNLSDLREAEAKLHAVARQFQTVFERAPLGISMVGLDGCIVEANQAMCDMTGFGRDELVGFEAVNLLLEEDRGRSDEAVMGELFSRGAAHVSMEHRLQRADNQVRWVLSDSSVVHDDGGAPLFIVTLSSDITERKMFEERLAHDASHDPLTALPNRSMLRELLVQAVARSQRRDTKLAVMFVDLDHFKSVNDDLGHAAGDDVLMQAASRIRAALRLGDVVARYGGDEFVVLCEDIGNAASANIIAGRICASMGEPFVVGDGEAKIGASAGVVLCDGDDDIDLLLNLADQTLYRAKNEGRGRAVIHELAISVAPPD